MNLSPGSVDVLLVCLALASGLVGAVVAVWWMSRRRGRSMGLYASRIEPVLEEADLLQAIERAVQTAMSGVEATLAQRIPQWMQQAMRVELDFQTRQKAEAEAVLADAQERRLAERVEQRMVEMRALLRVLSAQLAERVPVDSAAPPFEQAVRGASEVVQQTERELSDEEIDALPPELPLPSTRQRIARSPSKPDFRGI